MDAEKIAVIRANHAQEATPSGQSYCRVCGSGSGCDTKDALAALAASEARVARLEEALQWCAGAAVQAMSCAPNGPKILEIEQVARIALAPTEAAP